MHFCCVPFRPEIRTNRNGLDSHRPALTPGAPHGRDAPCGARVRGGPVRRPVRCVRRVLDGRGDDEEERGVLGGEVQHARVLGVP